ncbi:hypothetical protein SCUCBS95973_000361 [Sporothrix curviconia]|uniref:NDT80 domain-containing protein n=1 Tax=Sporothrix curviconia TaxID=1260050 RepID=A0ABP0API9_9PEZI
MAELKEPAHGLWTGYGSPVTMANGRFGHPGALDPILANAAGAAPPAPSPHSARPRTDATGYAYAPRYPQDDTDVYGRHHSTSSAGGIPHPSLATHQSYPNLKRTYSQSEQQHQHQQPPQSQVPSYGDMVQDLRNEDGTKVNVNQGHKLLAFKRAADKSTIVDRHGRIQQLDLSAQLHGMFFLSDMPASSSDGSGLQPELTCYRRNLFQISGTLITPRGQLSVVNEGGETVAVSSTELTISAIESVDGHPIRLIVIPWKTPPPNSPEVAQNPDQEPVPLPLIPFQDDGSEAEGEYAVYPIGWRRLQFRIATANNGRRKELQQHFVLHLKAIATLANGSKAVLAESTTSPIVVRGRSPRNFQARKEIPLLGSSAGSRGQALVETGMGIVAGPLTVKTQEKARAMALELPRSSFTFTAAPKMPPSPMSMRSNSYPTWNTQQMPMPPASAGGYPTTSMANEPYPKMPVSGSPHYTAEPQEMPMQQNSSMPSVQLSLVANEHQQPNIRTQYAYVQGTSAPAPQMSLPTTDNASGLSVPRYVDSNARPAKSPRHGNHDSVHSATSLGTSNDTPGEYRYGPTPYLGVGGASELSPLPHPHQQHGAQNSPSHPPTQQQGRPQQHSQPQSQQHSPSQPLPLPNPQQQQHHHPGAPQQHQGQNAYGAASHDTTGPNSASNPSSATSAVHPPPRDYYPPAGSWAQPPGDSNQAPYGNGESRHYSFPDQYKAGHQVKSEALPQPHGYAAPRGSFDATTMNNYSWSAA